MRVTSSRRLLSELRVANAIEPGVDCTPALPFGLVAYFILPRRSSTVPKRSSCFARKGLALRLGCRTHLVIVRPAGLNNVRNRQMETQRQDLSNERCGILGNEASYRTVGM